MTPMAPFLAELGWIEKLVITALAVAGGFLIGFLLTNALARLFCKFVWKKEPPEKLIRIVRFAGGVGAAILVYLLLTGDGGLGLGGRGGGSSNDKDKDNSQNTPNNNVPKKDPIKEDLKPKDKIDESDGRVLFVYLLRSDAPELRFYQFGDDRNPLTLDEVLQRIEEIRKADKRPITVVKIRAGVADYSVQAATLLHLRLYKLGIDAALPPKEESPSKP